MAKVIATRALSFSVEPKKTGDGTNPSPLFIAVPSPENTRSLSASEHPQDLDDKFLDTPYFKSCEASGWITLLGDQVQGDEPLRGQTEQQTPKVTIADLTVDDCAEVMDRLEELEPEKFEKMVESVCVQKAKDELIAAEAQKRGLLPTDTIATAKDEDLVAEVTKRDLPQFKPLEGKSQPLSTFTEEELYAELDAREKIKGEQGKGGSSQS